MCEDSTVYGQPRKHTTFPQHTMRMRDSISYITKHKNVFILYASGTLVAILYFLLAFFVGTHGPSFPVIDGEEDSTEYIYLAEHLLEGRGLTLSHVPPHIPESFRVPGYPLFVALMLSIYHSPVFVVIVQCFLFGGIAALVFLIASHWFDARVGYLASAFSIANPSLLFHTSIIASETVFLFLLLFAVYVWLTVDVTKRPIVAFASGILVGFLVLTRAVAILLPVAFLCISLVQWGARLNRPPFRTLATTWLMFILGCTLLIAPWSIRNKVVYDHYALSSTGTIGMWYFNIPQVMSDARGISVTEARAQFIPTHLMEGMVRTHGPHFPLRQLDAKDTLDQEIGHYLDKNLVEYALGHLQRSASLILVDGFQDTALLFGVPATGHNILPSNIVNNIRAGEFTHIPQSVWGYIIRGDVENLLALLSFLLWTSLLVTAGLGSYLTYRTLPAYISVSAILCCLCIIAYFMIMTGPLALPRLRLPLEPFVFVLSAVGILYLYDTLKMHFRVIPHSSS